MTKTFDPRRFLPVDPRIPQRSSMEAIAIRETVAENGAGFPVIYDALNRLFPGFDGLDNETQNDLTLAVCSALEREGFLALA